MSESPVKSSTAYNKDRLRICVHHVGGRSGSRGFPVLHRFEKDIINVLYDADPDCLEQVQERNQHLESELHVLPYCFGDECKTATFNITYDPYNSSLLDPNPAYGSYYSFTGGHDSLHSEVFEIVEERTVEIVPMDHIYESNTISIPRPDFLSLDTQGSEYEILRGAEVTLRSRVLALITEVEFHPMYKG